MNKNDAISIIRDRKMFQENAFPILQYIADLLNTGKDIDGQDLLLRVLEHQKSVPEYKDIINSLLRRVGLFPYIDSADLSPSDRIAFEYHRPINMLHDDVVFHRVQARVYRLLLSGFNVVLSAPTSFGKSLLIDALVSTGKYNNIILLVPTIALIDETRRRLSAFSDRFKIITHVTQKISDKNIFILTQERAISHESIPDIDLLIVDEFYKLQSGITQGVQRSTILNQAFYHLYKKSRQFYFLGPNIDGIPAGFDEEYECIFIKTDYTTVASDTHYINVSKKQEVDRLVSLCSEIEDQTLIYCRSPKRVRDVVSALLKKPIQVNNDQVLPLSRWIRDQYAKDWLFPNALLHGIGMHHGRLPRSLSHMSVKLFNERILNFLVCTSTLIEGVNTKAKNVVVLDNTVAMKKYDYFTFNNICGRSGRMFVHFVGNVYLFNAPPQEQLPFVDIPVYTQNEESSDELLVQLDDDDLNDDSRDRMRPYHEQDILPFDIIKANSGIDPKEQINLAEYLHKICNDIYHSLAWNGMPTQSQVYDVCELIWDFFFDGKGLVHSVGSGRQLAFKLIQLYEADSLHQIIEDVYSGDSYVQTWDDAVETVLDFLRYWTEFAFPSYLMCLHRIQDFILRANNKHPGDYAFYASLVQNGYLPPPMLALEEYGIPYPLIKKLANKFKIDFEGLDDILQFLKRYNSEELSENIAEQYFISEAKSSL